MRDFGVVMSQAFAHRDLLENNVNLLSTCNWRVEGKSASEVSRGIRDKTKM